MEPKDYLERKALDRLAGKNPTNADIAEVVKLIYQRMWSKDELTAFIVQTHQTLCSRCPKTSHEKIYGIDAKWFCGIISTLVTAVTAALIYFVNSGGK